MFLKLFLSFTSWILSQSKGERGPETQGSRTKGREAKLRSSNQGWQLYFWGSVFISIQESETGSLGYNDNINNAGGVEKEAEQSQREARLSGMLLTRAGRSQQWMSSDGQLPGVPSSGFFWNP